MLIRIDSKSDVDESKIRMRCGCGAEWSPVESTSCPQCDEKIPVAVTEDGITWKSLAQHKLDRLRQLLGPNALNEIPETEREKFRNMIQAQLAAGESGGGKILFPHAALPSF